jgi:serine/threonine-protein kinase RsbW
MVPPSDDETAQAQTGRTGCPRGVRKGDRPVTSTAWRGEAVETDADTVELRVPADPAYLAVIRTTTAGLAARLDLTLDEIEDLRIAVDEACGLLLDRRSRQPESLAATFRIHPDSLEVVVRGPAPELPDDSSYAWALLKALAGEVQTCSGGASGSWIRLIHRVGRSAS